MGKSIGKANARIDAGSSKARRTSFIQDEKGMFVDGLESMARQFGMQRRRFGNGWCYDMPKSRGEGWIIQMSPEPGLFCVSAWFKVVSKLSYTFDTDKPCMWLFSVSKGRITISGQGRSDRELKPMNQVVASPGTPITIHYSDEELICFDAMIVFEEYIHGRLLAGGGPETAFKPGEARLWTEPQINTPDVLLAMDELKWSIRKAVTPLPYYYFKCGEILMLIKRNQEQPELIDKRRADHVTWDNKQRIFKVKDAIDRNMLEPPNLSRLAALAAMSESKLRRSFKLVYGVTIAAYVREGKMQQAMRMLAKDEMSIRDIARACGYECAGRFSAVFRKIHHITPSQYRKSFDL
ncbi:helix-turn-helix transcriptional regulator [Paenibacillus agaridevorans]|nr:AraC family transcriptional regulator [Paenibacillus agaridevorans]